MLNPSVLVPLGVLIITFVVTYLLVRWWIKRAQAPNVNLVGKDMNKLGDKKVAEMGGLPVLVGFVFGLLVYLIYRTFIRNDIDFNINIISSLATLVLIGLIGVADDLLGWKIGLKPWQKPILCFLATLPIAVVNYNLSIVNVPLFGDINLGLFYPLLLVPFFVSCFSNGYNLFAGYNGLEASMGVVILTTLGFVAWYNGLGKVSMMAFIMVAALIAFLFFNWCPAKVFPGDTLTLVVGAMIMILAVYGNMIKLAFFLFIPYFIDLALLFRARSIKVEAFGKPKKDGSLDLPYKRCYDTTHIAILILKKIKKKAYEWEVVTLLILFEILLVLISILVVL
ncbi:glycosyl transferase family 4 [Candidatus Woesearchaeota archaeon]|nr:glycosyl transferase family 4 [Candidatus Woesearchaeota archaeon]